MKLENYLSELGEQKFIEEEQIKLLGNPNLQKVVSAYEDFLSRTSRNHKVWYKSAQNLAKKIKCSANDIKDLSIIAKKYETNENFSRSGVFFSVLINNSEDKDFEVLTRHLLNTQWNNKLSWLGYKNNKNITVEGSVGSYVGFSMEEGKIIVKGNAETGVGSKMQCGEIIIEGKAFDTVGELMQGGYILVKGAIEPWQARVNSTSNVGYNMKGGLIEVNGTVFDLGNYQKGGKIILQGNVHNVTGYGMNGGEILVTGNSGVSVGHDMKKGKITIKGNSTSHIGLYSKGGEIYIEGEITEIRSDCKAKVYQKGVLVWPK